MRADQNQLHACSFDGPFYNQENNYTAYADDRGFIALFPSSPNHDKCWDVSSKESLTHDGNGDSTGLANMVKWAISEYNADPTRIYVTGSSSGCMMTNVLCGTYPDMFAAASCYSGVPAGCLAGSGSSPGSGDPSCGIGNLTKTGEEWAEQVYAMYEGYEGLYPKTMIWHGTADDMISYNNLAETLKQWSTVLNVSWTKNITDTPFLNYTEMVYGDGSKLLGWSAVGVGHTVPCDVARDLDWFDI